jgi:hypothetical protein
VVNEEEKKVFITNYFMQLFRSSAGNDVGLVQQLLDVVQPRVTAFMNEALLTEFSDEEIKRALAFMNQAAYIG